MSIFTTTIALSLALFFTPCTIEESRASQYAEGVFQRVVGLRQDWGQLPEDVSIYDGFIAVRECSDVGKAYYVRPVGAKEWDYVLAADCASPNDRQSEIDLRSGKEWMISENVWAEIDHKLAVKWKIVGYMIDIEMLICNQRRN